MLRLNARGVAKQVLEVTKADFRESRSKGISPLAELAMTVQHSHQNAVRVREIVPLAAKLVGPFCAVEEIVAQPPDDHKQTQHPVTWVVIREIGRASCREIV